MTYYTGDSKAVRAASAAALLQITAGTCPYLPNVGVVGGISSPLSGTTAALVVTNTILAGLPRVKVRRVRSIATIDGVIFVTMEVL